MFDPTVFDNLKVVLEGAMYDLDLAGAVNISNRSDLVNLATMSREYKLEFTLKNLESVTGQICLQAQLKDLSAELLGETDEAGCDLVVKMNTMVSNPDRTCALIEQELQSLWSGRPDVEQVLSYRFGQIPQKIRNTIVLSFGRKITENQIEDFDPLIELTLESVRKVNEITDSN